VYWSTRRGVFRIRSCRQYVARQRAAGASATLSGTRVCWPRGLRSCSLRIRVGKRLSVIGVPSPYRRKAGPATSVLPLWFEIGSMILLVGIFLVDLLLILRRPHVPSMREASLWVGFYVLLALLFAGAMFFIGDVQHG